MGSRHYRRGRVRSLELDWRRVGANGDGSCCSTVLGRVSPLVAEVTAIASVSRMLRSARVSVPLTVLSDSEKALGVVLGDDRALSELPLVPLARSEARHHRQRPGIEEHASNGAADRLAEGGQRRSSPAHSRFFQSQSHVPSLGPTGSFGAN